MTTQTAGQDTTLQRSRVLRVLDRIKRCGRRELGATVAVILILITILDLIFRAHAIGWQQALVNSAKDPGKTLFHALLLPLATYLLVCQFPLAEIRGIGGARAGIFAVLSCLLFAFPFWYTPDDMQRGFCERGAMPEEIGDANLRGQMSSLRDSLWSVVRPGNGPIEDSKAVRAKEHYKKTLTAKLGGNTCNVWRQGSTRAFSAGLLTLLGIEGVCLLFVVVAARVLSRARRTDEYLSTLLTVFSLLTPWFILRPYSEWYNDFGYFDASSYAPLSLALIAAVGVAAVGYLLWRRGKRSGVIIAGLVSGAATVVGVTAKFKPEYFGSAARMTLDWRPRDWAATYFVLFIIAVLGLVFMIDNVAPIPSPMPHPRPSPARPGEPQRQINARERRQRRRDGR